MRSILPYLLLAAGLFQIPAGSARAQASSGQAPGKSGDGDLSALDERSAIPFLYIAPSRSADSDAPAKAAPPPAAVDPMPTPAVLEQQVVAEAAARAEQETLASEAARDRGSPDPGGSPAPAAAGHGEASALASEATGAPSAELIVAGADRAPADTLSAAEPTAQSAASPAAPPRQDPQPQPAGPLPAPRVPPERSGAPPLDPGREYARATGEEPVADEPPAGGQRGALPADRSLSSTPTGSVVINLINKLVEKGVLGAEDAKQMVVQAKAEAETQQAQNQADMFAVAQIAATQAMSDQAVAQASSLSPLEASREEMRVSYIPAPVRDQIAEDVKRQLAADGFGGSGGGGGGGQPPPGLPALLYKLDPSGEIRMRYEADLYPQGNDASGAFPNFNAINTGPPFDVTGTQFAPQWNTDQNRNRFRLLVRFGLGIDLGENFSAGLRLATGDSNSPVSGNQSMGLPYGGQGGQFSKYAVWLDRAYLRYDLGGGEDSGKLTFWAGRFDNPFFSTPLIFDDELGFDGAALRLSYNYRNIIMPAMVAGAFPVFNTDLNFSSTQPAKYPSYDKYLFAVQAGTEVNITRNWNAQVAAAYYYFQNIEGQLSSPYVPLSASDAGDTDNSRPSFAQKGNTYMPLRQIIPDASNDYGAINQWQYYGLATPFQNLALTGQLNYDGFEPVRVSLVGEFVQNLAFNSDAINDVAVNNRGEIISGDPDIDTSEYGPFDGSGTGWLVDLEVGHAKLDKRGAWQLTFGYRWIGSDAVVDGFNDSDFGLGGTNMKGFTVGGRLALSPNVYVALRWFGSESIAGPQYDMNIFQLDLGAKF